MIDGMNDGDDDDDADGEYNDGDDENDDLLLMTIKMVTMKMMTCC